MLRGEFIRGDGLVIPNNITAFGARAILVMALRGTDGALVNPAGNFWVGLCDAVPAANSVIQDLIEPTIGVNGYTRFAITRNAAGWPGEGQINGEWYLESGSLVWAATGSGFSAEIGRMFISASQTAVTGDYIALSQPLPTLETILPTTPVELRTFRYRIYLR